jgi:hypothetical protein
MISSLLLLALTNTAFSAGSMTAVQAVDLALEKNDPQILTNALKNGANIYANKVIWEKDKYSNYQNHQNIPVLVHAIESCSDKKSLSEKRKSACLSIIETLIKDSRVDINAGAVETSGTYNVSVSAQKTPIELAMSHPLGDQILDALLAVKGQKPVLKYASRALSDKVLLLRYESLRAEAKVKISKLLSAGANPSTENALAPLFSCYNPEKAIPENERGLLKDAVAWLQEQGIDFDKLIVSSGNAFEKSVACANHGGFPAADHLLETTLLGDQINAKDAEGRTMLHRMAFACNADAVKYLIERGADVSIEDNKMYKAENLPYTNTTQKLTRYNTYTGEVYGKNWNEDCKQTYVYLVKHQSITKNPIESKLKKKAPDAQPVPALPDSKVESEKSEAKAQPESSPASVEPSAPVEAPKAE